MPTPHAIIAVEPTVASEPGALNGFDAVCTCGTRVGSSLQTLARQWGEDHAKYYNRKEGSK